MYVSSIILPHYAFSRVHRDRLVLIERDIYASKKEHYEKAN